MKASELKKMLDNTISDGNDLDIVIKVEGNSFGQTPIETVNGAGVGFDWDNGKLILYPTKALQKVK